MKNMKIPRLQHHDLLMYLPEDIMVKVDRASMANSLETRCPLLDHELIEFALCLPQDLTFGKGVQKVILKEPLLKELGKNFVNRPKMGFGVPLGNWFNGPWKQRLENSLIHNPILPHELIDVKTVRQLLKNSNGYKNFSSPIYFLLTLAIWWKKWNPSNIGEITDIGDILTKN